MESKVLTIINNVRSGKGLNPIKGLSPTDKLREDLEFSSFDLAELTVKIEDEFDIDIFEDGLVSTVGEIFEKLK